MAFSPDLPEVLPLQSKAYGFSEHQATAIVYVSLAVALLPLADTSAAPPPRC